MAFLLSLNVYATSCLEVGYDGTSESLAFVQIGENPCDDFAQTLELLTTTILGDNKYISTQDLGGNDWQVSLNESALNQTILDLISTGEGPFVYKMNITTSGGQGSNLSIDFNHTVNNFYITPLNSNLSSYQFQVHLLTTPNNPILKAKRYTGPLSYLTPFEAIEEVNVTLTGASDDTYEIMMVYE